MSVQAMSWVFEHSEASGTDRLVLLALANHAGQTAVGDAWESWPSVERIAREAAVTFRTAQESLARLEREGHIVRVIHGSPDDRVRRDRRTNLYRILLDDEAERPSAEPVEGEIHSPQEAWQRVEDEVRSDDTPSENTPQSVPELDPETARDAVKQHPVESPRDAVTPQVVEDHGVLSGDVTGCGLAQDGVRSHAERGALRGRNGVRRDNTLTITKPSREPSGGTISETISSSSTREAPAAEQAAAAAAGVEEITEAWEDVIGSRAGIALKRHIAEAVEKFGADVVQQAITEAVMHDSRRWAYVERIAARLFKAPPEPAPLLVAVDTRPAEPRHHALWQRVLPAVKQRVPVHSHFFLEEVRLWGVATFSDHGPQMVFSSPSPANAATYRREIEFALYDATGEEWEVFIEPEPAQAVAQ